MIDDVLAFWFGVPGSPPDLKKWFSKDDAFDAEVRRRFGATIEAAAGGGLEDWKTTPRGRLAFVIVCDQFSRNVFRGTPRAFAQDALALETTDLALKNGDLEVHDPVSASFVVMPFVHAENRARQERAIALFQMLATGATGEAAKYLAAGVHAARQHAAVIERFGRFPHRNAVLGRASTPEEEAYLAQPDAFRA